MRTLIPKVGEPAPPSQPIPAHKIAVTARWPATAVGQRRNGRSDQRID